MANKLNYSSSPKNDFVFSTAVEPSDLRTKEGIKFDKYKNTNKEYYKEKWVETSFFDPFTYMFSTIKAKLGFDPTKGLTTHTYTNKYPYVLTLINQQPYLINYNLMTNEFSNIPQSFNTSFQPHLLDNFDDFTLDGNGVGNLYVLNAEVRNGFPTFYTLEDSKQIPNFHRKDLNDWNIQLVHYKENQLQVIESGLISWTGNKITNPELEGSILTGRYHTFKPFNQAFPKLIPLKRVEQSNRYLIESHILGDPFELELMEGSFDLVVFEAKDFNETNSLSLIGQETANTKPYSELASVSDAGYLSLFTEDDEEDGYIEKKINYHYTNNIDSNDLEAYLNGQARASILVPDTKNLKTVSLMVTEDNREIILVDSSQAIVFTDHLKGNTHLNEAQERPENKRDSSDPKYPMFIEQDWLNIDLNYSNIMATDEITRGELAIIENFFKSPTVLTDLDTIKKHTKVVWLKHSLYIKNHVPVFSDLTANAVYMEDNGLDSDVTKTDLTTKEILLDLKEEIAKLEDYKTSVNEDKPFGIIVDKVKITRDARTFAQSSDVKDRLIFSPLKGTLVLDKITGFNQKQKVEIPFDNSNLDYYSELLGFRTQFNDRDLTTFGTNIFHEGKVGLVDDSTHDYTPDVYKLNNDTIVGYLDRFQTTGLGNAAIYRRSFNYHPYSHRVKYTVNDGKGLFYGLQASVRSETRSNYLTPWGKQFNEFKLNSPVQLSEQFSNRPDIFYSYGNTDDHGKTLTIVDERLNKGIRPNQYLDTLITNLNYHPEHTFLGEILKSNEIVFTEKSWEFYNLAKAGKTIYAQRMNILKSLGYNLPNLEKILPESEDIPTDQYSVRSGNTAYFVNEKVVTKPRKPPKGYYNSYKVLEERKHQYTDTLYQSLMVLKKIIEVNTPEYWLMKLLEVKDVQVAGKDAYGMLLIGESKYTLDFIFKTFYANSPKQDLVKVCNDLEGLDLYIGNPHYSGEERQQYYKRRKELGLKRLNALGGAVELKRAMLTAYELAIAEQLRLLSLNGQTYYAEVEKHDFIVTEPGSEEETSISYTLKVVSTEGADIRLINNLDTITDPNDIFNNGYPALTNKYYVKEQGEYQRLGYLNPEYLSSQDFNLNPEVHHRTQMVLLNPLPSQYQLIHEDFVGKDGQDVEEFNTIPAGWSLITENPSLIKSIFGKTLS